LRDAGAGAFELCGGGVTPLGHYLLQTIITLAGVVALAVLVLYAARRIGVGRAGGPLALLGRMPLDGRRAVYLVKVGKKVLILGASEQSLTKLGELDEGEIDLGAASPPATFREVFARLRAKEPPREG
jgi:flagellar protein FliO/FliZ